MRIEREMVGVRRELAELREEVRKGEGVVGAGPPPLVKLCRELSDNMAAERPS
jgi:hypothetical protein